jgi:uncharacterized protein (DUF1684 family)
VTAGPVRAAGALLALLVAVGCAGTPDDPDMTDAARAETEAFRARHEESYLRQYVTIAGLHFLEPGSHTAGSTPSNDIVLPPSAPERVGRFVLEEGTVRFEPAPDTDVRLRDEAVTGPVVLRDDSGEEADEIVAGGVRLVIHRSGDRLSLRVWDPEGEQARSFLGFSWFPIQAEYRVSGTFVSDGTSREVQVVNTFGDLDTFTTEGVVEFVLRGETLRLRPFTTRPGRLYFVFRDASAGVETYSAARFLYADLAADGSTVLDFNQAYNPPCAFNPYTTCPIPLPENRLPVKVLAGERAYPESPPLPEL